MELNTDEEIPRGAAESEARIYVLADSGGAVGAFLTRAEATAVKKRYPSVPMLIYAFPLRRGTPADKIYVIPYRQTNAVAYASNSRAECEEVQKTLLTIGLAYEDSLDYWECDAGRLIESGEKRLHELQELERLALDGSAYAEMKRDSRSTTPRFRPHLLLSAMEPCRLKKRSPVSSPRPRRSSGGLRPRSQFWSLLCPTGSNASQNARNRRG
jgi:hypothetical protein